MKMHFDARDVARTVSMRHVLMRLGVRVRNSKRANCPLCKGNSTGTLAFTERLWRCHRCNEGGDVYTLVCAVNRCDFPAALRYVAELGGVRIEDDHKAADTQREIGSRQQQRDRISAAADKLVQIEHALRLKCCHSIHECDRVLCPPGPWDEARWQRAQAASVLRDEYLLPVYTLLSFGATAERAQYALHSETRARVAAAVRWAGGVRDDEGRWREALQ
jgi:hypothetical protein